MVLAPGAIVTSIFAMRAFRKQSQEVALLQQQAERDYQQRRRAQAAQVFVWVKPVQTGTGRPVAPPTVCLRNSSSRPIYDISVKWGTESRRLMHLMPGEDHVFSEIGPDIADHTAPVSPDFRDTAGACWETTSLGALTEVPRLLRYGQHQFSGLGLRVPPAPS